MCVCVCVCVCVERDKEVHYKELAHSVREAGQQARDPGEPMVRIKSEGILLENVSPCSRGFLFVFIGPSTDWVRPTTA